MDAYLTLFRAGTLFCVPLEMRQNGVCAIGYLGVLPIFVPFIIHVCSLYASCSFYLELFIVHFYIHLVMSTMHALVKLRMDIFGPFD